MPSTLANFTLSAAAAPDDFIVGYDEAVLNGERRWSVSTIANAVSGVMNTQLNNLIDQKNVNQSVAYDNLNTDLKKRVVHAWVNFSGVSGAIRNSYNVSSVSVFGTGQYGINFTSNAASGNYAFAGMCGNGTENPASVAAESVIVTNTLNNIITIMTVAHQSNAVNFNWVSVIVFQS